MPSGRHAGIGSSVQYCQKPLSKCSVRCSLLREHGVGSSSRGPLCSEAVAERRSCRSQHPAGLPAPAKGQRQSIPSLSKLQVRTADVCPAHLAPRSAFAFGRYRVSKAKALTPEFRSAYCVMHSSSEVNVSPCQSGNQDGPYGPGAHPPPAVRDEMLVPLQEPKVPALALESCTKC